MNAQLQENEDQGQEVEESGIAPETIAKAKEMGWVPKEKYKGPGSWVDADEFVERGEKILPILKHHNETLKKDLLTSQQKIARLEQAVEEGQKAIKAFQKIHDEETEERVRNAEKELKGQIREAKLAGDVNRELELIDALDTLKEQKAAAERKAPVEETKPRQPADEPWAQEWFGKHKWFGGQSPEEIDKTAHMQRIGYRLRKSGTTLAGELFMDECLRIMEEERMAEESGESPRKGSKVEGGATQSRSVSKRPFDNLPSDVKKYCNEQASERVGKGKRHETLAAWQDFFAAHYEA